MTIQCVVCNCIHFQKACNYPNTYINPLSPHQVGTTALTTGVETKVKAVYQGEDHVQCQNLPPGGSFFIRVSNDGTLRSSEYFLYTSYDRRCLTCTVMGNTQGSCEATVSRRTIASRVAKFKRPRILGDQKISEDNQNLRPNCPPDYQIFRERIDPKCFIPTNLSSYLSLTNKNSSVRTSTTYI